MRLSMHAQDYDEEPPLPVSFFDEPPEEDLEAAIPWRPLSIWGVWRM